MAIGILLASFVVSSLLVPAVTTLAGARAWWPGRRRAKTKTESATSDAAPIGGAA